MQTPTIHAYIVTKTPAYYAELRRRAVENLYTASKLIGALSMMVMVSGICLIGF